MSHVQVTNQLLHVVYPAGGQEAGSDTTGGRPLLASLRALHLGRTRVGAGAPLHRLTSLFTLTFSDQSLMDAGLQVSAAHSATSTSPSLLPGSFQVM